MLILPVCFTRPHGMFLVLYRVTNHMAGPPLTERNWYIYTLPIYFYIYICYGCGEDLGAAETSSSASTLPSMAPTEPIDYHQTSEATSRAPFSWPSAGPSACRSPCSQQGKRPFSRVKRWKNNEKRMEMAHEKQVKRHGTAAFKGAEGR